jgi:hypothetical protein
MALTRYLAGNQPRRFKTENLLIHLANGLLVFWLASSLFYAARERSGGTRLAARTNLRQLDARDWWPGLLVAALWLLHPLQVSTVTYAVQRLVLLSTFFSLLTAVCYMRGRLLLATRPWGGLLLILIGFLSFWPLGLMSKENAALMAPTLLAVEWLVLRLQAPAGRPRLLLLGAVAVFLLLPNILGLTYLYLEHEELLAPYVGRDFTLQERVLTQVHALWHYLQLILVPIPGKMALFNDWFPVQRTLDAATIAGALALLAMPLIALALRRPAPLVALGILWFFIWHGMESTILPLELVFEHRNYLALLGPALVFAVGVTRLYQNQKLQSAAAAGAVGVVLLLALNTASRAHTWGDADRFAANEFRSHPDSPRAVQLLMARAIARHDLSAVATLLSLVERAAPDKAWPLLVKLRTRCSEKNEPTDLLQRLYERLENGIARPADVEQLTYLTGSVYSQLCPPVSKQRVVELAKLLAANTRVHSQSTRIAALNLYARVAASQGDLNAAREAIRESLALGAAISPGWLLASINAASDAASHHTNYDEAIDFIKDVTRGQEQRILSNDIKVRLNLKNPVEPMLDQAQEESANGIERDTQ